MHDRLVKDDQLAATFKIGLKPVQRDVKWLSPFDGLGDYLTQKSALFAQKPDHVFGDIGACNDAQGTIWSIIAAHLTAKFPHIYKMDGADVIASVDGQIFRASYQAEAPLLAISRLVADDLVVMQKSEAGWRLAAGSVCFPSAWFLPDKLGQVMGDVHGPVPDFQSGSRNAMMIERIFDHLPIGETVQRTNWSVYDIDVLRLPTHPPLTTGGMAKLFLRGEVQTLTKIKPGNEILFTIGIDVDPLENLAGNPHVAGVLADQIAALNNAQLAYKGLSGVRDTLHNHLKQLAKTE